MKKQEFSKHEETICCPECGNIEKAQVKHTWLWYTYIHECTNCDYVIMESEWQKCD